MVYISIVRSVLMQPIGVLSFILSALASIVVLFVVREATLLSDVVTGRFPFDVFVAIAPKIITDFFIGNGVSMLLHYIVIAVLMGLYVTLLIHIFFVRRFFSLSSFSTGLLGLSGIAIGISCLSCGALAGVVLLSALGALGVPIALATNEQLFLLLGEGLLLVSIFLVLYTIKTFRTV